MGKNQAYKAMQRARLGSSSAGPEEIDDGMADGSFHSPEWHAARMANLKTSHTITWEEFKKKQKGHLMEKRRSYHKTYIDILLSIEEEVKKGELEADKDRMMREYRAQLDAEREKKLSKGRNHVSSKLNHKKDKDKTSKKHSSRKRKHSRTSDSSSSSSTSESSSSDNEHRESRRMRSRSKRSKKERKRRSRSKHSGCDDDEEAKGPLPLSRFFGSMRS